MIRVLVVDDHPVVREGVRQILAAAGGIEVGGMASDAASALAELAGGGEWALVLLDLSLPGRSGVALLTEIRQRHAAVPVLVLSVHADRQLIEHVLRAGAAGYLTKESAPEELVAAVRHVAAGGRHVSAAPAAAPGGDPRHAGEPPLHETLSAREREVFYMIAAGKSVKTIALELSLGQTTVSTYRARVLEKLRLRTTADLIRYAVLNALVE